MGTLTYQNNTTNHNTMADIVDKKPDIMIENPTKSIVPVETTVATHDTGEHPPTRMEKMFIHVGTAVAYHPWKFIIGSVLISCALASGFFTVLVSENRPEKQWVPTGAAALEQKAYVDATWPSTQRFNFWIAQCKKTMLLLKVVVVETVTVKAAAK